MLDETTNAAIGIPRMDHKAADAILGMVVPKEREREVTPIDEHSREAALYAKLKPQGNSSVGGSNRRQAM